MRNLYSSQDTYFHRVHVLGIHPYDVLAQYESDSSFSVRAIGTYPYLRDYPENN